MKTREILKKIAESLSRGMGWFNSRRFTEKQVKRFDKQLAYLFKKRRKTMRHKAFHTEGRLIRAPYHWMDNIINNLPKRSQKKVTA